ncbi:MAG: nicotinamide n-methyltransferase [Candelina submexicana]|nr:MAG: nicotinamide n-methyltransferase [Candelina submexicana]
MNLPRRSEVDEEEIVTGDLFKDPVNYYELDKPATNAEHTLLSGEVLTLRLIGHSPLWGHLLWNAGRVISDYIEGHAEDFVRAKNILELGAGAGLPSLVCALHGAQRVIVTDYPDADLIENLRDNISSTIRTADSGRISAEGYLWGAPTEALLKHLEDPSAGFDTIILADLLFNHSEHGKLVTSVRQMLKRTTSSRALVFFTPYRPWLLQRDISFFDLARNAGFVVEKVLEKVMDRVMFVEDPGDETLRRTVYGYQMRRDLP